MVLAWSAMAEVLPFLARGLKAGALFKWSAGWWIGLERAVKLEDKKVNDERVLK